jgi:hypothetical protein
VICVEIDIDGYVIANGTAIADCTDFVLMLPTDIDRLTYFADLAIALDPSEPALWAIMGAMLLMHVTFYGLKAIRDIIRRPNH